MEFHGKIIEILDLRGGTSARTGDKWTEQSFVVESDGRYPVRICFSMFGEKKIKEANLQLNAFVNVYFDISSRKVGDKWFNDISAYRVEMTPKQPYLQSVDGSPSGTIYDNPESAVRQTLTTDEDLPW